MKISNITVYAAPGNKSCLLVRIDTDEGLCGWGECSPMNLGATMQLILHDIAPQLIGSNPSLITQIQRNLFQKNYKFSGQLLSMAISGIEIALWDLLGKSKGLSVCDLLGGPVRNEIRYYGSSMSRNLSAEEEADKLSAAIDRFGFQAVKFKLGPRMGNHDGSYSLKQDVLRVRTIRRRLGDDIILLVDGNSSFTAQEALWLYNHIAEYDIAVYEEPCPYTNRDAYIQLYERSNAPVSLGEQEWNPYVIRDIITSHAAQFISCDVTKAGGFQAMRNIAALCDAFDLPLVPHNTTRGLGHLATMQLIAALPCCSFYHEYSIQPSDAREMSILNGKAPVEGRILLDNKPGVGAVIHEELLEKSWQRFDALHA